MALQDERQHHRRRAATLTGPAFIDKSNIDAGRAVRRQTARGVAEVRGR